MYIVDGRLVISWHIAIEQCMRLEILGQMCSSHGCLAFAAFTCYWPGSTSAKCRHCQRLLARVADALGFELQSRPLDVPRGLDDTERRFSMLELH